MHGQRRSVEGLVEAPLAQGLGRRVFRSVRLGKQSRQGGGHVTTGKFQQVQAMLVEVGEFRGIDVQHADGLAAHDDRDGGR